MLSQVAVSTPKRFGAALQGGAGCLALLQSLPVLGQPPRSALYMHFFPCQPRAQGARGCTAQSLQDLLVIKFIPLLRMFCCDVLLWVNIL